MINPYDQNYDIDDLPHYYCGHCIYHSFNRKLCRYNPCKRIDNDIIKFAKPWFKVYDANKFSGYICSDFQPDCNNMWGVAHWTGFEDYWKYYVKEWIPYSNTNFNICFCLNNDFNIRYAVHFMDFVNGTMIEGNRLKAVKKIYDKRTRKTPYGWMTVAEPIDGVILRKAVN